MNDQQFALLMEWLNLFGNMVERELRDTRCAINELSDQLGDIPAPDTETLDRIAKALEAQTCLMQGQDEK